MADTKIRITSELAGEGFEKATAGLTDLEAKTAKLNALGAQATTQAEEYAAQQEMALKVGSLALEVAEKQAIIAGDETQLKAVRAERQEWELKLKLAQKFGVTLEEATPLARQLLALEMEAEAAIAARVAARDLEIVEMRAQASLNAELVAAEGARLAQERRITIEKEKQAAIQTGMLKRAAGQVAGAAGIGGVAHAAAGGIAGVAGFIALEVILRGLTALMEGLGDKSEEAGKKLKENGTKATEIYDGLGRKIGEVKEKTDEFKTAQEQTKKALEGLHDRFKAAADQAERLRRAEDALSGAKLGADLAGVDLAEARGQVTPEEGNAQRAKLRVGAERAKLGREAEVERAKARDAAGAVGEIGGKAERGQQSEDAARNELAVKLREQAAAAEADAAAQQELRIEKLREEGASFDVLHKAKLAGEAKAAADEAAAAATKRLNETHDAQERAAAELAEAQRQLAATNKEASQKLERISIEQQRLGTEEATTKQKVQNAEREKLVKEGTEQREQDAKAREEMAKFKAGEVKKAAEQGLGAAEDIVGGILEGEKGHGPRAEAAAAEKARKAEEKAAKEKFDAENERRAKRGARPLEEDEFNRLEATRARNKANADAANAPTDFNKLFPKKTPAGSASAEEPSAKAAAAAGEAVSASGDEMHGAAAALEGAAGKLTGAAGRIVAVAEQFDEFSRRLAALEANSLNA